MTDQQYAELFLRLAELRTLLPEMRVGQLIANLSVLARGAEPGAIWDMEDDELSSAINAQIEEIKERRSELAQPA
jgi:hypothetical protein